MLPFIKSARELAEPDSHVYILHGVRLKNVTSFRKPTRLMACANYGNHVKCPYDLGSLCCGESLPNDHAGKKGLAGVGATSKRASIPLS